MVSWWFLGGVSVVSRWFLGGVSVVIRPCLGGFLVVSWWFLSGFKMVSYGFFVVSWWFVGGFLDGVLVLGGVSVVSRCSWLFPNSNRLGLLTLKAVGRHRAPGR